MAETFTSRRHTPLGVLSLVFFFGIHLASLSVLWLGVTWRSIALAVGLYWLRMFGITAGYHRYFSHRAYKTSRFFQFVLACLGAASLQKGPLWWAAHHRTHHRWSDTPRDLHSPKQRGFWHAHLGWILSPAHDATDFSLVPDLARYPELLWLNRYYWVPALALALVCHGVDGVRGVVWGMGVGTVLLWHCTFFINSLAHVWGTRRYDTTDTSRNNFLLALVTMGEGWHNNHHYYMNAANQGFFWWEVDVSYYILRVLCWVRVVRELRVPPSHVLRPRLSRAANALLEVREVAEAKLSEVREVAEAKLSEVREVAEAKLSEVREVAEAKLSEAREVVTEVTSAAEQCVRSAVEHTVEEVIPELPNAT